jgi:hypothetical protein
VRATARSSPPWSARAARLKLPARRSWPPPRGACPATPACRSGRSRLRARRRPRRSCW